MRRDAVVGEWPQGWTAALFPGETKVKRKKGLLVKRLTGRTADWALELLLFISLGANYTTFGRQSCILLLSLGASQSSPKRRSVSAYSFLYRVAHPRLFFFTLTSHYRCIQSFALYPNYIYPYSYCSSNPLINPPTANMRFFETILSAAAFVAAVAALEINQFPAQGVVAGQTYTITYSPADNTPTTIILRQGQSTNLDTVATLTATATGGKFEWTPEKSLPNEPDYALQIQQGTTINYSAQFPLTGGSGKDVTPAPSHSAGGSTIVAPVSPSHSSPTPSAKSSLVISAPSTASPSVSISPSAAVNATVSTPTLSGSRTGSAGLPEVTNSGANPIGSPFAAMFGAAAFFAYFV